MTDSDDSSDSKIPPIARYFDEPPSIAQAARLAADQLAEARQRATSEMVASPTKTAYEAVELAPAGQRARRIRVYYSNGHVELWRYRDLENVFSAGSDKLGLLFNMGAVFLRGECLRDLLDAFQAEQVTQVQAFDAERHFAPAPGTVVIHWAEWKHKNLIRPGDE